MTDMQTQELENKVKTVKSGSQRKLERAKEMLESSGLLDALEEGRERGETPAETIERIANENAGKPSQAPDSDPLIDAIFDEWMQQAETIEQLREKVKKLEAKTKKQKNRIAELEAKISSVSNPQTSA